MEFVNIYNDSESAIIIDEGTTDLTAVQQFSSLGASPFNVIDGQSVSQYAEQNAKFVEMHIFDEAESLLVTLNSAKPLLRQPSTGKFYFGPSHKHNNTYMVGEKHRAIPHETLEVVRSNQLIPYPLEQKKYEADSSIRKKFALKMSEIFEVLSNIPNVSVETNDKFIIKYAIFADIWIDIFSENLGLEN